MYDVALSVAACARRNASRCRLMISPAASKEAVMITPGRALGCPRQRSVHRIFGGCCRATTTDGATVRHRVEEWEASMSGLPATRPWSSWWSRLPVPRGGVAGADGCEPVIIDSVLDGDDVTQIAVTTSASATGGGNGTRCWWAVGRHHRFARPHGARTRHNGGGRRRRPDRGRTHRPGEPWGCRGRDAT